MPDILIRGLECDSRKVLKDFLFVMIPGEKMDGRRFAGEAVRRGAAALAGDVQDPILAHVPFVKVPEPRLALAKFAAVFYGYPNGKIRSVGITGTNGKTTSAYLIEHFLSSQNKKTGVMGTVSHRFNGKVIPALETTPGPLKIQQLLSQMVAAGCQIAVMEVSSHALSQSRVSGVDFETALFTNLTQDHLDYHKTMEAYFECKSRLFLGLSESKTAILNIDDAWTAKLLEITRAKIKTYGLNLKADFRAENIECGVDKTHFNLTAKGKTIKIISPLVGLHNVYNVLGSLATAESLGLDLKLCADSLTHFTGVPGRLEPVNAGQNFLIFIDYAHTPDGLENVLKSLLPYKKNKLVTVFGCGGERDKGKRPKMGRIASFYSDYVFVTSDNPRSEDPRVIAEEIRAGFPEDFKNFTIVVDRQKAIRQALLSSRAGDVVLLAGKGHEMTQIIDGQTLPFNDRQETERVLSGR
ncbi:MAG: UDP-N-acetylmuramoyl-L-alanyl-D-glutamate--2,6-diaminopimelate ligase [Candidatus Omnitrophica bacterium CG1_02_46_14]|nr:MAG: UDP-N-acetylmuramoyl-L-alanyl-D-glutamate--2,6-diaminopimelate ligase [Candidatus Omnitrophica bacterium CG1_02_46_14]